MRIARKTLGAVSIFMVLSSCSGISAGAKFLRSLGVGSKAAKNVNTSSKWYHSFKSSSKNLQRIDDFKYFFDPNEQKDKKHTNPRHYINNSSKTVYWDITLTKSKDE